MVLAEIYAARESNTIGISSADLAEKIPGSTYWKVLESNFSVSFALESRSAMH